MERRQKTGVRRQGSFQLTMRIGALQKQSFIDWQGKIVAVIFTKGCNFRCGYCHNPALVLPELINQTPDIPEEEVLAYLKSRKGWLEGVVITGGEPTIHKDLGHFLREIKQIGYDIKLDSNGTHPQVLQELIDLGLIDFIAMDIKTIVESKNYVEITHCKETALIENIESSIKIIKASGLPYQFRTTAIPLFHPKEILGQLEKRFKEDNYLIQQFREGDIIDSYCHLYP